MSELKLPKQSQVVIIGGGVIGCSVAYHLTKFGWKDVLLLERKELTSGTTWHAAGLVGQLRSTRNMTMLAQYTSELFAELETKTGQATGFKQNGSISVAPDQERFEELKRGASMAKCFGLEVEVITAKEALDFHPYLNIKDLCGAVFLPKDGQTNPIDTTRAMALCRAWGLASGAPGTPCKLWCSTVTTNWPLRWPPSAPPLPGGTWPTRCRGPSGSRGLE